MFLHFFAFLIMFLHVFAFFFIFNHFFVIIIQSLSSWSLVMSNIWWCANYSSHLTTKDSGVIHREWDRSLDDTQWLTKNKSQRKHMQLQHWLSTPHTWATTMDDQCTWENRRMATTKMKNPRECSGLLSSLLEPMFIESCVVEWRVKDCNTQTHFLFSLAPRSKYHQCSVCVWNWCLKFFCFNHNYTWNFWSIPDWKIQTKFV